MPFPLRNLIKIIFKSGLFVASLLVLCGMSPPYNPLFEGKSTEVLFPSFNVNYSLLEPEEMRHWRLSVELAGSTGKGDDMDYMGSYQGDPVLGGVIFPRWEDVKLRYSLSKYTAIIRGGLWVRDRAGFELFTGAGRIDLKLKVYYPGLYAGISENQYVVLTGGHITAPFPGPFNFYFRGMRLENRDNVLLESAETGLNYLASESLNIYAAGRRWNYQYEGSQSRSDIHLDLSGYVIGLRLLF